ncbi:unnamed protein product [Thlaspi arvense]|uniref:Phorbol-ester/DAG-type domain-containing protein n=1 Tax=Thlaspi arvense TaxID=13288 RepID=A0AAU9SQS2_THLAR|nr:unnamed protein product [Thlaspi arvense]
MDSEAEGVSLPLFHEHLMVPRYELRIGDCCGRSESSSEGFYCKSCDFFVHKKCADETSESIQHPSHPNHTLKLQRKPATRCSLCGKSFIGDLFYRCEICNFDVDLYCAKYPPPDILDVSDMHWHDHIDLLKEQVSFDCFFKCGKIGDGFPYICQICDVAFHMDCVWQPTLQPQPETIPLHPRERQPETIPLQPLQVERQTETIHSPDSDSDSDSDSDHSLHPRERWPEIIHSYHSLHPLKFLTGKPPDYSDGKCRLCGGKVDTHSHFYHCSSCNFTLDHRCAVNPPAQTLLDLKVHDHKLTLLPRLDSFTCNACGLKGDRSPYVCFQCGFMIHQDCLALPRLININRHDHRVSRTSVLGLVNSVCTVCHRKVMEWTCGGYCCKQCPGYVVHSKCATRIDVWNGRELEGVPEEKEDIEPYVVIDESTIHHFSHREHYLRLNGNGLLWEENKRCDACSHSISLQSFYGCTVCDFSLHKKCAEHPKKKWHVLHNERLALVTSKGDMFRCNACTRVSNGFRYQNGDKKLDVRCSAISEPFFHPSHPHHPLYYIPTEKDDNICSGCNLEESYVLRCIVYGCGFVLGFACATLPQVVKHRVDDHPLSLCYGEKASGKYWCDICEKETNPEIWFYTCKDHRDSLHTMCVLGDCLGLMPRSTFNYREGSTTRGYKSTMLVTSTEVVLNNSMSRTFCIQCNSRCMYPIILKALDHKVQNKKTKKKKKKKSLTYVCSETCMRQFNLRYLTKEQDV